MSAPELVQRYLEELAPSWTPATLDSRRRGLEVFLRHLASSGAPLGREAVLGFARQLQTRTRRRDGQPWAPRTRQWALLALRGLLKWALLRGLLLQDLSRLIIVKRVKTLPRTLPEDKVKRLIEQGCAGVFAARDRAVLELLYGTGLRASELLKLELSDIALGEGLLHVRQGKGRKDRVVPFGEQARSALLAYLRGRPRKAGALFLSREERRLSLAGLRRIVRAAARRAQLAPVSSHRLRHSCATHLLRGGADVRHVQALLGHASLRSTEVYLEVDVRDLASMLERSHPRERGKIPDP